MSSLITPNLPPAITQSLIIEDEPLTRTEKMRIAARVLIRRGVAGNGRRWGLQTRLAEHFGVTRQRVSQIVRQELKSLNADPR
jgi:hypothetical protein